MKERERGMEGLSPKITVCRNWVKLPSPLLLPFDEYVARDSLAVNGLIPCLVCVV